MTRKARKTKPKPDRKRCKNCDGWFNVNPQAPHKLFCGDPCRKEYHRLGGSPRKLIDHVESRLPELVAKTFAAERGRLEAIREEILQSRDYMAELVARFETARHGSGAAA